MQTDFKHTLKTTHLLTAKMFSEIDSIVSSDFITDAEKKILLGIRSEIAEIEIRLLREICSKHKLIPPKPPADTINMYNADKYGMK